MRSGATASGPSSTFTTCTRRWAWIARPGGVYRRFTGNADDFPRRGTRWFRDWFYPLWRECGRAEVMNRFFRELARHFPRDSGGTYTRRMNWGEYVHFTSGAAAADMSGQAARAFGWPREWAGQLEHAREQFPGITY